MVVRVFRATCDMLGVAHVTEAQCGGGCPKHLFMVCSTYLECICKRIEATDKVTRYFHNGVLAPAGQKCQCACAEQWEVADIRYSQHSYDKLFEYVKSGFVQL